MKDLNNARRLLVESIISKRIEVKRHNINDNKEISFKEERSKDYEISVLARTKEEIEASLDRNVNRIYLDKELYEEYKQYPNVYLRLPRVNNTYPSNINNVLVTELGGISKYTSSRYNIISDYYLNVINNYSINFLLNHNVKRVTLSPEINYYHLDNLIKDKVELIIYGRLELMITKSCPIKELDKCPCNKEDKYYLEDINKNRYPIIHNNCLTQIMHYKNINYLDNIDYYKKIGIKSYRLELFDEDYNTTIKLIDKIRNN